MARPFTSRTPRRVQVSVGEAPRPSLPVAAPINVRTPGAETSPLAGLVQALGIGAGLYAANQKARAEDAFAQGQADEQLGEADMERAQRSRAYADGAYQVSVLEIYQNAEAKVAQKAADELDHSLPIDEQIATIDAWMKAELGPMISDDRAKVLFAERYSKFIDSAANAIQKNQLEANAKAAEDTVLTDVANTLKHTGDFTPDDWNENFHRLYSQTGDAVGARKTLVAAIMQAAINSAAEGREYAQFRDMIPTEVIGPDGAKLPGPMRSPEIQALVLQSMDKAKALYDEFHQNEYAGAQAAAFVDMDQLVNEGAPITLDTFKERGYSIGRTPNSLFSPERAAALIDQAARVRAQKAAKQAVLDGYVASWRANGRLADTLNAPGGPDSQEKLNDFALSIYQSELAARGVPAEAMSGEALVKNADAVNFIAMRTAQEGVPYEPLRTTLNSINPSAPGDVTARLSAYKQLKARNLTGMYVDDESALVYEAAIGAETAGMDKEGIADTLRKMGDKDASAYVAMNMGEIRKDVSRGVTFEESGLVWDTEVNSNQSLTAAYINGKYQSLAASALARGLTLQDARRYATERIQSTHALVKAGDDWMVLPRTAVPDPAKATKALDWYTTQLPKLAIRRGIPEDEELTIRPVMGLGRSLTFQVYRAGGVVPLENTSFTLPGLLQTYQRSVPEDSPQALAAKAQERARAAASAPRSAPGSTAGLVIGQ